MKKIQTSVVLLFVFVAHSATAAPGFFSPASATAPRAAKSASGAVLRFVAVDEQNPDIFNLPRDLPKIKANSFLNALIYEAVQKCVAQGITACSVPHLATGTAFVTGAQHDTLITVRHNLKRDESNYLKSLGAFEGIDGDNLGQTKNIWLGSDEAALMRNMPLHFALYDAQGTLVFDTRRPGDFGSPEVMGFDPMLQGKPSYTAGTPLDFVSIRLSRPLGSISLAFAPARAATNDHITVVGFPSPTNSRADLDSAPDSDGFSQYYSVGNVSSIEQTLTFHYGPQYQPDPDRDADIARSMIFSDCEVVQGLSGSPALNHLGQVVGIVQSIFSVAVAPPEMYMPHRALILHSEWLTKNFELFSPSR